MAAPSYIRNGYVYVPAVEAGVSGLVGAPVLDVYSNTGLAPSTTGAIIVDSFVLPARVLDVAGQALYIAAFSQTAANINSKTLAINFGGTGSVGGAVTGGTTVSTTVTTVSAEVLAVYCNIYKTGASTQVFYGEGLHGATWTTTSGTMSVTDTATIQINLINNAATAATDMLNEAWTITFNQ